MPDRSRPRGYPGRGSVGSSGLTDRPVQQRILLDDEGPAANTRSEKLLWLAALENTEQLAAAVVVQLFLCVAVRLHSERQQRAAVAGQRDIWRHFSDQLPAGDIGHHRENPEVVRIVRNARAR